MSEEKKRDDGDGTFRILPNGTLEYTISLGRDAYGKRQRKPFYGANPAECKRKARMFLKGIGEKKTTVTEYTLGTWLDRWLKSYRGKRIPDGEKHIAQSTLNEYTRLATRVKGHKIAGKKLTDIKPIMVSDFFGDFSEYSYTVIKKTRFLLNAAFEAAIENDYCYKNPIRNAAIPQKQQGEKETFSDVEVSTICKFAARDKQFGIAMLLLLNTGMRSGELRAIRVEDINFDDCYVDISKAIKETGELGPVKNRKPRVVPIKRSFVKHLKKYLLLQSGYILGGNEYLGRDTLRSSYKAFFNRLNKYLKVKGKEEIKMQPAHCCRHTFSTALQRRGVPMPVVATLLGHSSLTITNRYTHLDTIEDLRKAIYGY